MQPLWRSRSDSVDYWVPWHVLIPRVWTKAGLSTPLIYTMDYLWTMDSSCGRNLPNCGHSGLDASEVGLTLGGGGAVDVVEGDPTEAAAEADQAA